jgi:hypothetical protein
MPEHRMWPPAGQRSATTGIYTPERSDGPELAALRRDWPRYDTWHREGIASDATMPPLGEGEPWMPATYLERLRRQYMVHLHDGGAPSDIEAAQGLLHALRALGPKEPAVALVPAPRDPVAARAAFEAEGYLYYPPGEVLGPAELRALQLRFAQEEPAARQRWREELRAAGAEGLGHTGDRMISVGDTEEWFASAGGLLHACMGASPLPTALEAIFGGAAVCRGAGARILPPEQPVIGAGPMGAPQGYVSWHRGKYCSSSDPCAYSCGGKKLQRRCCAQTGTRATVSRVATRGPTSSCSSTSRTSRASTKRPPQSCPVIAPPPPAATRCLYL